MGIDKKEVEHIAALARLYVPDEEKEVLLSQLGGILDYVAKLNELDTSGVAPTSHVLELKNVMRDDATAPSLALDDALLNAPVRSDNFYRVPKIIE